MRRWTVPSTALPLISGALFGGGLAIGGMIDPARVLGFLDLFGAWDPTLVFVMASATAVMAFAWLLRKRIDKPAFGDRFFIPDRRDIDNRLLAGSAIFGIGWGLAGICPGPAVTLLALRPLAILPFLAAMIAGMLIHRLLLESPAVSRSKANP